VKVTDGPWVGLTTDQAKTLILQAALAYKQREGKWPQVRSGPDNLLLGASWEAADRYLRKRCGTCLYSLLGGQAKPSVEEKALSLCAFSKANKRWPKMNANTLEERRLACALRELRRNHPEVCSRYNIPPPKHYQDDHFDLQAMSIMGFRKAHKRWPSSSGKTSGERRLGRNFQSMRRNHPEVCTRHGLPLQADRGESMRLGQGRAQFFTLGVLVSRLCRYFRSTLRSQDIDGDSGVALSAALRIAHTAPPRSRGLGYAPDLCQVNSIARANYEIEHGCWRFTLKGARKPDKRPWAAILAAGDNTKIETAERVAFLDWENPDADAPLVGYGSGQAPATRRPWSPPATQPEAGRPAPAKRKGKRASAKG